jgi:sialate O-acetylesterase
LKISHRFLILCALRTLLLTFVLVGFPFFVRAEIKLPSVLSSHMVLQRDQAVPVWGLAAPGEEILVTFNNQSLKATADAEGKWMLRLSPMPAGGPFPMTISGKNTIQLEDILIGEVWFCSGQSNMGLTLRDATNAQEEIAAADYPQIRIFDTKRAIAETPQFTVPGAWRLCNPATVGGTSAVAYFFGQKLHKDLGVPVGILHSSWGGTAAEVWMPRSVLEKDPDFQPILESWDQLKAEYPELQKQLNERKAEILADHEKLVEEAKKAGTKPPATPKLVLKGEFGSRDTPTGAFYGMVGPHIPFAIKGVIWYQGEANAGRGHQYRKLFPALISSWREAWGMPELPFLFVQLPNMERKEPPKPPDWAEVREAQLLAARSVPQTGMAVTIDVGDPKDLHPKNKKPVGERLAHIAMRMLYGVKDGDVTGPLYRSSKVEAGKMILSFDHASSGLQVKGGNLTGFVIAGEDKKWMPAEAKIDGDTVLVSSPGVAAPVAVRYAWADNPVASLYNQSGLPASPFRTDDWPENTVGKNRITQSSAVKLIDSTGAPKEASGD